MKVYITHMEKDSTQSKENENASLSWWDKLSNLIWGILILQGVYWLLVILYFHGAGDANQHWANAGTFGDMFGGLTCLFSGFAFAGLIVTIRQQRRELNMQVEELERTRDEFAEQTKQFRMQNALQEIQGNRADVYRRIEMLKLMEREVSFRKISSAFYGDGTRADNGTVEEYHGMEAVAEMSTYLMANLKILFSEQELNRVQKARLEDFSYNMFMGYTSLQPLFSSIDDLFRDIQEYFGNKPKEILRHYRMVINVFTIHLKSLLCLYKGYDISKDTIDVLLEKQYILQSTMHGKLMSEETRQIVADLIMQNISVDQARKNWLEMVR